MLEIKSGTQIEKFEFNEVAYTIKLKNYSFWAIHVSRKDGAVTFLKSVIIPGDVDKFEARRKNGKTEIYLHTTDRFGSHEDFTGETDDNVAAEAWVSVVNGIYEDSKKSQELAEVAD